MAKPFAGANQATWISVLLAVALYCPNTQELMRYYEPCLDKRAASGSSLPMLTWRPTAGWALAIATMAIAALLSLDRVTPFLYFQF